MNFKFQLSWLLIIYRENVYWLYASRILAGFTVSSFFNASPVFVSEICSDTVRGSVNSLGFMIVSLGGLVGYIVANFVNASTQAVCALSIPIVFALVFSFVPESPEFLYRKNKIEVISSFFLIDSISIILRLQKIKWFVTSGSR